MTPGEIFVVADNIFTFGRFKKFAHDPIHRFFKNNLDRVNDGHQAQGEEDDEHGTGPDRDLFNQVVEFAPHSPTVARTLPRVELFAVAAVNCCLA
jgi:hypothetical protein